MSPGAAPDQVFLEIDATLLKTLAAKLRAHGGPDLLTFKTKVLKRRLWRRLRAAECGDLAGYLEFLETDPSEYERLSRTMSIPVSGFFRNPETYTQLRRTVLPRLFERSRSENRPALLVSAGAAQGEEIYSLAILARHYFPDDWERGIRLVGVDMDEQVLAAAKRAVYERARVKQVPRQLFKLYFKERAEGCRLDRRISEAVEFIAHDLLRGLPVEGADLVLCRNLLIYYSREHQIRLLEPLARAIVAGGFLVLGKTESLPGPVKDRFAVEDSAEHIYRKLGD